MVILLVLTTSLIAISCATGDTIWAHKEDGLHLNDDEDFQSHKAAAGKYACLTWDDLRSLIADANACESELED